MSLEIAISGTDLYPLIWIPRKFRSLSPTTSPLTRSTLICWDLLCKTHKWQYNSPLMPLTGHNYFPPGNIDPRLHSWNLGNAILLHQVIKDSNIVPLSTLTSTPTTSLMDQWRYLQLSDVIQALPKPLRNTSSLTPIESAFVDDLPVERPLSYFYQALGSLTSASCPNFLHNWEKDLHRNLTDHQKASILLLSHSSSISSKTAEVNYKLLTRCHYTPAILHKLFPQKSPLCWRGCGEVASHAHVWWFCPFIRPFWLSILYWIKEIQGSEVPNDPWYVLLHCTDESTGSYKKSITPHLLNAAKALIPRFCKTPRIPSLRQWLSEVDHLYFMEDLTYSIKNKCELGKKIWSCWFAFKYTAAYAEIMASNP